MSAVKNLRAMFEQKHDASPPDRGRSPGLSSNGAETPPPARPLSKIRTNFVAVVEKDGRVGLRRDPSNESTRSLSQRRLSGQTEGETSVSGQSDKTMATEETSNGYKTTVLDDSIPESPQPALEKAIDGFHPQDLGALTDKPSHNPDKHVDVETPTPDLLPGDPKTPPKASAANGTKTAEVAPKAVSPKPVSAKAASPPKAVPPKAAPPKMAVPKAAPVKDTAKAAAKPSSLLAPISIKTRAKTPTRSPTTVKTPTLPHAASKSSAHKPTHEPAKKTTEKAAGSTPKSGTKVAGATKKPAPVHVSPSSGTGFVKPKPKSPTRPVRLPPSLMAPTAASVSKVKEASRETLSRASGNVGRPASRASAAGGATTIRTLKRQNSVINRPRPSIGPPPKKPLQDHPITKKDKEVDENFLARMMRPTQASSSKLTEKAPVTPPRNRSNSAKKSVASKSPRQSITRAAASRTGSPVCKRDAPAQQATPVAPKPDFKAPVTPEPVEPAKAPVTPEPMEEGQVEEAVSVKTLESESGAQGTETGVSSFDGVGHEFEELAGQTSKLSLKGTEHHDLKDPEEFEILADEKETNETTA